MRKKLSLSEECICQRCADPPDQNEKLDPRSSQLADLLQIPSRFDEALSSGEVPR